MQNKSYRAVFTKSELAFVITASSDGEAITKARKEAKARGIRERKFKGITLLK